MIIIIFQLRLVFQIQVPISLIYNHNSHFISTQMSHGVAKHVIINLNYTLMEQEHSCNIIIFCKINTLDMLQKVMILVQNIHYHLCSYLE